MFRAFSKNTSMWIGVLVADRCYTTTKPAVAILNASEHKVSLLQLMRLHITEDLPFSSLQTSRLLVYFNALGIKNAHLRYLSRVVAEDDLFGGLLENFTEEPA
jgi:hypothetical protein